MGRCFAGKSGISNIDHFDATQYKTRFAGLVRDLKAEDYMPAKELRRYDEFMHYALAAGVQAMNDAKLNVTSENASRIGVAMGSGIGGLTTIEDGHTTLLESGPNKISPFFVPGSISNMAAGLLAIRFGLKGPNFADNGLYDGNALYWLSCSFNCLW
jgi:3-oxoacyl-[acyl-carrier-protein] synthase II